jgi:hypothetical protein
MRRGLSLAVLVAVVCFGLYLPIKIPYELVSIGNVTPLEEWRLMQDAGGSLMATRRHFRTGMVSNISVWQFQEGDISGMEMAIRVDTLSYVERGDTVLRFFSTQILEQIALLEQELAIRTAERGVLVTGEKLPTVEEAQTRLNFSREQLALAEKQYSIDEPLFRDGVIARLDYERSKNALELARIAAETAEKTLRVVSTGAKPELVTVNKAQIESLTRQLRLMRQRYANYVVTAPFDAIVSPVGDTGEVIVLQNTEHYLIHIPVRTTEVRYLGDSTTIEVRDLSNGNTFQAEVVEIGKRAQVVGTSQVNFLLAAVAPTPGKPLNMGLTAQCTVRCDALTPLQYLRRLLDAAVISK